MLHCIFLFSFKHWQNITLATEIGSGVWGTPANFNGFRVWPSLQQWRRSPDANQTLHDVWPSPGLVHNIYVFGGSWPPDGILPGAKFTLHPSLAFSYIVSITAAGCQTLWRGTWNGIIRNFRRGRHLYSAGWPSHWVLAHILVLLCLTRQQMCKQIST